MSGFKKLLLLNLYTKRLAIKFHNVYHNVNSPNVHQKLILIFNDPPKIIYRKLIFTNYFQTRQIIKINLQINFTTYCKVSQLFSKY